MRGRENAGGSQAIQPGAYSSKQQETLSETQGKVRADIRGCPLISTHLHVRTHIWSLPKLLEDKDLAKFSHEHCAH